MVPPNASSDLEERPAQTRDTRPTDPSDIVDVVENVLASFRGDNSAFNEKLHADIEALARYIRSAKAEIVAIRADEIDTGQLPAAAGELSAIVAATEEATHAIIGAAETIEEQSGAMPTEVAGVVTAAVTRVYEACGFQDVTGQRIAKVVDVLEEVEVRVQALLDALNEEGVSGGGGGTGQALPPTTDEDLMGEPRARETVISQDDVDAILAGYD